MKKRATTWGNDGAVWGAEAFVGIYADDETYSGRVLEDRTVIIGSELRDQTRRTTKDKRMAVALQTKQKLTTLLNDSNAVVRRLTPRTENKGPREKKAPALVTKRKLAMLQVNGSKLVGTSG